MNTFLSNFGKNLKEKRKLCGFSSQEKFAEAVGISTNAIAAVENGKSFFKMENYEKVCKVLNISPDELFNFNQSENNKQDKILKLIMDKVKKLSPKQRKQVLKILETFD